MEAIFEPFDPSADASNQPRPLLKDVALYRNVKASVPQLVELAEMLEAIDIVMKRLQSNALDVAGQLVLGVHEVMEILAVPARSGQVASMKDAMRRYLLRPPEKANPGNSPSSVLICLLMNTCLQVSGAT